LPKLQKWAQKQPWSLRVNDFSKNEDKIFIGLLFYGFVTPFPNIISKISTLYSTKVLSSKSVDPILQGTKNAHFFTSNAIILQTMRLTFLKRNPLIISTD
jgi:hypothetical protein